MKSKISKESITLFLLLLVWQVLPAQEYRITFSGTGQSSSVETVEVKNIDQQTTLMLNGTDTLLLTSIVGTSYLSSLKHGMIIYPNPANHSSHLDFYTSSSGKINIEIYKLDGRLITSKLIMLVSGDHAATITGLNAGIYTVKVTTPEYSYHQKLISTASSQSAPQIHYDGIAESHPHKNGLKFYRNVVVMQYNEGERVLFKAISGNYTHIISMVPTANQNINFEFVDCIDFDGNQYGVVTIGDKVWMVENLKTTHYRNGTPIDYPGNDTIAWENNSTGAYAWYNNDIFWKDSYGALYNWFASTNTHGLCPVGWHVPSYAEWSQLVEFLTQQGYSNQWGDPNGAGNALKSCQQVNSPLGGDCNTSEHPVWNEYDTNHGFDAFGFSSFPGGCRHIDGSFHLLGSYGFWWSSTWYSFSSAWFSDMSNEGSTVFMNNILSKGFGMSIRCIRN